MSEKQRIDVLILEKGLAESREKAQSLIMSGVVYVNEQKIDKVGQKIDIASNIEIRGGLKFVSRGGLKLEKAIEKFSLDLRGMVCLDIGSSTGGFTDCMLQNGARKVYAIDVGYGQLAWQLRNDQRVVTMERTNIRYVTPSDINDVAQFASIDVSFISLSKVFPVVKELLESNGTLVSLIKPQFEAGREKVGKKGVVRDSKIHEEVIINTINNAKENGLYLLNLDYSPIKGPEGNIEYLAYLSKCEKDQITDIDSLIKKIVNESHMNLNDEHMTHKS